MEIRLDVRLSFLERLIWLRIELKVVLMMRAKDLEIAGHRAGCPLAFYVISCSVQTYDLLHKVR